MSELLDITKEQIENLPDRKWDEPVYCDSFLIVPTDEKHDSGFMCMDVIALDENTPICKCSGYSDVIHLNGIGGYGEYGSEAYDTGLKKILFQELIGALTVYLVDI